MTDFNRKKMHFKVIMFMKEAGIKLHMNTLPMATAARVYHKFFQCCNIEDYDPYLIGTTSLYLAGKVEEQHLRMRDVINVCHRCLNKDKPLLEIGPVYWAMRETIAQTELLILRVLRFNVSVPHPHKYLLHYIKSLQQWLHPATVEKFPIASTAWTLMQDSYHGDICLYYKAEHIAVAVLYFTLQCHGIEVPHSHSAEVPWWKVFVEDIKLQQIRQIITQIIDVYNLENTSR